MTPYARHALLVLLVCQPLSSLESRSFDIGDNDKIEVAMDDFPERCCHDYSATITYTGSRGQHIRAQFTDIDVPDNSILLFVDENNEKYSEQPVFVKGRYRRQGFAFDKSVVRILFQPSVTQLTSYYASFKLVVWTTTAHGTDWKFWPASERCPWIENTADGGVLQIQSDTTLYDYGVNQLPSIPRYDCIWVFKIPEVYTQSEGFEPRVYVSLLDLTIPDGLMEHTRIEVRRGKSSSGTLLASITPDSDASSLEDDGRLWTADEAIYMRLLMPYTSEHSDRNTVYSVRIGYGIYTPTHLTDKECDFGRESGVTCLTEGWCVPEAYKCNGLSNCPGLEDESNFNCGACGLFSKQCYSSSQGKYLCYDTFDTCPGSSCEPYEQYCKSGLCIMYSNDCEDSSCGYQEKKCPDSRCIPSYSSCKCGRFEKECPSGSCIHHSDRCPSDSCPYSEPFRCDEGYKCLPASYECDGTTDCTDGTDEHSGCSTGLAHTNLAVGTVLVIAVLIPVILLVVLFCVLYHCCKGHSTVPRPRRNVRCLGASSALMAILIPIIGICVLGFCCYACCKKSNSNTRTPGTTYTGTQMTPVATTGPRPVVTGYAPVPSNDHTPHPVTVPSAPQSNDVTSDSAMATRPPQYSEALDTNTYPLAKTDQSTPPPPSYESLSHTGTTNYITDPPNAPERVEYWSTGSFMPIQ